MSRPLAEPEEAFAEIARLREHIAELEAEVERLRAALQTAATRFEIIARMNSHELAQECAEASAKLARDALG